MSYLWKRGYYVQRAFASKGIFDIVAIAPKGGLDRPLLIQAKGDEKQGYVDPEESERLKIASGIYNAYCCIAFKDRYKTGKGKQSKNKRIWWRLINPYSDSQRFINKKR